MDVFEALADPTRRSLLLRLRSGPARVVDLASAHQISRPAISKHLRILTDAGLVCAVPSGRERHYRLVDDGFHAVQNYLDRFHPPAPPIPHHALEGLDLEVRRTTRERRATRPGTPARPDTAAASDSAGAADSEENSA